MVILDSSATMYDFRTDYISNYVVVNTDFFYWANIDQDNNFRDQKITGDIDPSSMLDLALSGNKAVLFF